MFGDIYLVPTHYGFIMFMDVQGYEWLIGYFPPQEQLKRTRPYTIEHWYSTFNNTWELDLLTL
jgi:hypothetical protein